jgi:hypothetical protein
LVEVDIEKLVFEGTEKFLAVIPKISKPGCICLDARDSHLHDLICK